MRVYTNILNISHFSIMIFFENILKIVKAEYLFLIFIENVLYVPQFFLISNSHSRCYDENSLQLDIFKASLLRTTLFTLQYGKFGSGALFCLMLDV